MNTATLQQRLGFALRPMAAVYGAAVRLRAARYGSKFFTSFRASCPVISVGNISWGGTGKTPVVDYLLDRTGEAGLRTVVLTRGYKASPPELPFLVRRNGDPREAGDEPLLLARRHPETMIIVDPKRSRAAAWAEANASPDLLLLDDGMQHLAMARDIDIVLLKADDLLDGWNKVIPAGTWREDASALARAHAFCIKADSAVFSAIVPVAESRLAALARPLFSFSLQPTGLVRLAPYGENSPETASGLGSQAYILLCGTGDPAHVAATAEAFLGRPPSASIILSDHHHYTSEDAIRTAKIGKPLVCTAKDAVKLIPLLPHFGDVPVWILDVRTVFGPALFTTQNFDQWWRSRLDAAAARLDRADSMP